ncbi:MAG: DKNYY domain-containing protein [Bdellovibrionaceae bacterium]|jgi:hypothetical protein|nr:DKNYY domain-containing protein [Pseudobdellovibrionaceae bacterium]
MRFVKIFSTLIIVTSLLPLFQNCSGGGGSKRSTPTDPDTPTEPTIQEELGISQPGCEALYAKDISKPLSQYIPPSLCPNVVVPEQFSETYSITDDSVYHYTDLIVGIDPCSLEFLDLNFIKDKHHVYFNGNRFTQADVASFQILNENYSKDVNNAYTLYANSSASYVLPNLVAQAHAASFVALGGKYAKDSAHVFYSERIVQDADLASFSYIYGLHAKDSTSVYYNGSKTAFSSSGFTSLGDNYYAYGTDAYFYTLKLAGVNPAELVPLSEGSRYYKTSTQVLYQGNIVANFDMATLSSDGHFIKDKNNVYYNGELIYGLNSIEFINLGNGWSKDKTNVYFLTNLFLNDAAASFEKIGESDYFKDDINIYYKNGSALAEFGTNIVSGFGEVVLAGDRVFQKGFEVLCAHAESFEVINYRLSRDKFRIYHNRRELVGANPETIQILGNYYMKDENHVFESDQVIEGADALTFKAASTYLGYDKNRMFNVWDSASEKLALLNFNSSTFSLITEDYFKLEGVVYTESGDVLTDIDANSVEFVGDRSVTKDNNSVQYSLRPVTGSHPGSFELIGSGYAKDNALVYYKPYSSGSGLIIANADPSTFQIISSKYSRDNSTVYFEHDPVVGADPATFKDLGNRYASDATSIYKDGVLVSGFSSSNFHILNSAFTTTDTQLFYYGTLLDNIDPNDANLYWYGSYVKDTDSVYFQNTEISGINASEFKIFYKAVNYAYDNTNLYYRGALVPGAAPLTLRKLIYDYVKDDNFLYYKSVVITGIADPASLELFTTNYMKDNTNIYYYTYSYSSANIAVVIDLNVNNVTLLPLGYLKDSDSVHYKGQLVINADSNSFAVLSLSKKLFRDNDQVFLNGVAIPDVHPDTINLDDY